MDNYTPLDASDNTIAYIRDFYSVLDEEGKEHLEVDVAGCSDDLEIRELARSIRTGLVIPMKTQGGLTPTVSPRFELEDPIANLMSEDNDPISRNLQQIRENCLQRDGFKCVVTGYYSRTHPRPPSALTGNLETAHIIPFTLGTFDAVDRNVKVWANIRRYFPLVRTMKFGSDQINKERNILTLWSPLHKEFGEFRLCFEETGERHRYRLKTFYDTEDACQHFFPKDGVVKFTSYQGDWDLPDKSLLRVHAAVCHFLHMAGRGEAIEKAMRDYEELSGLAPGGGTNIEDLMAVGSLSLASESRCPKQATDIFRRSSPGVEDKHKPIFRVPRTNDNDLESGSCEQSA
ncbi:hypothetical protein PENSTE_c013G04765 [Penicillium steckii]|uniref:HNH nuclease domain-containing protein n=1 Tax=Penicillium steckii TaxID=303698 RepID=A0A1V6T2L0_9EURO|nr:hypothetical protein PENSTE_c013G04765 [Penicillium steckii]